jgi:mRNA interferase RelE/StbE
VKVFFRESFSRDLEAVNHPHVLRRVREAIASVERARTFQQIPQLKRLETKGKYYRIRIGDYRLGLVFEDGAFTFIRCLDRKELYRFFP